MKTKCIFISSIFAMFLCIAFTANSFGQHKKKIIQKQIVAVIPVYVYAQEPEFKAFAGLDLPNQLHVIGTVPKTSDFQGSYTIGVNIVKLDGPGAIGGMDSIWYWRWKPFASDTGKIYTIKYLAGATRHGGSADTMLGSFRVKVYPLTPEDPNYYPRDEHNYPTAYTGIPFKVNAKYKDLDGDYKIEMHICDKDLICELRTTYGPYAEFISKDPKNEGKDIEINIYYRSYQSNFWVPMRTDHAHIVATPLAVQPLLRIDPSKERAITAYYGMEGYYTAIPSAYLEIESAGYFEPKAMKIPQAESGILDSKGAKLPGSAYLLKPTDRYKQLTEKESALQIIIKDPVSGKQTIQTVTLTTPSEANK